MADLIFEHSRVRVYHGDWRNIELPEASVDVTLTDPPYTGHVHANVRSITGGKVTEYDIPFDPLTEFSHVTEMLKVTKRWVLAFCALEQFGDYVTAAGGFRKRGEGETLAAYRARGAAYVRSGIWRKCQAAPAMHGKAPANSCEGWALMLRRETNLGWNGGGTHAYLSSHEEDKGANFYVEDDLSVPSFIQAGREKGKKRHPAQKPMALCQRLATWFVNSGDIVLDAYAGSGNLAAAAFERGASVIVADTDPEWAAFLVERFEALAQLADEGKI